ncbi:hypothetical protein [Lysobacter niastensis]|uniref:Tetratricopeptide repeat protein n=1 Tax=Lysobacter niastensis TaxID=380629 RepID=A0ABS0BD77_9GAMM|nr:hypothetical protein [Lysobacter niastensis]MBF6025654.1 hypothetical protein [Lysobacter niastensis]
MKARPRIEPRLGRIDALRFREGEEGTGQHRTFAAARWLVVGLVAIVLLLLLRQPLSNLLWPDTRAQQLRADAAQALFEGRLTSPDRKGARELYEAALALDPDRMDAREGLARVGQAALKQGRDAVVAGRYADAHRMLALAQELAVPRAQTEKLANELRAREAADSGTDELLARAAQARRDGRLEGDANAALPLYQRVLTLQPDQIQALEGREDTLADLLQSARQMLTRGELAAAAAQIHRVQAADPGHVELPDALADLARQADRRHRQAAEDLRRGRLPQALEGYRSLIAANPEDSEAERGISQLADAYAARGEKLASDFRFEEANAALREAEAIDPDAPSLAEARRHVVRARQSQQRHATSLPPAERQRRLKQLLSDAAAAEARGDLLTPPGDSAFDKVRAARAMAPGDAGVQAASMRLLPAAKRCFEDELRSNRLNRAGACLDAWQLLEGSNAVNAEARRRLAQRWIAVGYERLGAGELQSANAALNAARTMDPGASGLAEFANRVRAASAAHD